ncbi:uncharacterized protein LOC116953970 isoform X2 [Petromyzon marinus]|uniref:uncharacterized protein LOC116953970 isoform X2 n=1 Tax=Petromyzon marinus TaxID=7757 RepID=UPI003F6FC26B
MRSLPTASAAAWLLLLLHLLLHLLLLHLVACQALSVLNGPYMTSSEVVRFEEVMQRSYCRPMETMVPVSREFPDEVAHFFRPACVPLLRCSGCCNDEGSECVPTHTTTVTIQVRPTHTTTVTIQVRPTHTTTVTIQVRTTHTTTVTIQVRPTHHQGHHTGENHAHHHGHHTGEAHTPPGSPYR